MPTIVVSFNQTGNGPLVNLADSENLVITENASVIANNIAIAGTAFSRFINVQGTVLGGSGVNIGFSGSYKTDLVVGQSGFIGGQTIAVRLRGGSSDIYNAGEIVGYGEYGIVIEMGGSTSTIDNHGTISADTYAVTAYFGSTGTLNFQNYGNVISDDLAFDNNFSNTDDNIVNRGYIKGDIDFGQGNDMFDGRGGVIDGTVYGGLGDDTYYVSNADTALVEAADEGTERVYSTADVYILGENIENLTLLGGDTDGIGNSEANNILGSIGDNVIRGNDGTDIVNGGGGDDIVYGNGGGDEVRGGGGRDTLRGGSEGDNLIAGSGADKLFGGSGNDALFGGNGRDTLKGGLGRDTMNGGANADTFVFDRVNDSLNSDADMILNFTSGEDLIDLSGMSQNLTFIGGAGFSGTGAEVRATVNGGGDTLIRIDADGNGSTDMKIVLNAFAGFEAYDILL